MIKLTTEFFVVMDDDISTPHGKEILGEFVSAYNSGGRKFNHMSWQGFAVITSKSRANELKKLNIPTLVIHGEKDKLFDYANGEALARLIPNAKLITIRGGSHMFPQIDTRNDEYFTDMLSHFQSE
jgi:pimeloyl-ACP methyl ester carboxylesterase